MWIRLAMAIAALAAVLVPLAPVSGQSETPAETVVITARLLELSSAPSVLRFWANGELCGALDLLDEDARDADANAVFVLGGPEQPAVCGTEGQLIRITTADRAFESWDQLIFSAGARVELTQIAPPPPGSIPPVNFWVTPEAIAVSGQLQTILVRAGDDVCLELDLRDADEQGLSAGIGYADQPDACADIEAVFVTDADANPLSWSLRIGEGIHGGPLIAEPAPESTPPAPAPPEAGSGLARPAQPGVLPYSVAAALLIAGVVALAATARKRI